LGQFLVVAHLLFIVYEFAQKPAATYADTPCVVGWSSASLIAGRNYHWAYESTPLKIVSLLDLPALFVGGLASRLFSPLNLCALTASWVEAILALTFASIQWLLVGFIVESIFRGLKKWKVVVFNQPAT
jgi:integral membrane sensor domain MASE1